ncbi:hypothetical protein [Actinoplanes sp. G11-F43]
MDDIEDDLLSRCADMTGPLIVVNDPSYDSSLQRTSVSGSART